MKRKPKTLPKLKAELQIIFNAWIRQRDEGKPCISCGQFKPDMQAGHFYAVGGYDGLRFNQDNCHAECVKCNCFDESHLIGYSDNLLERIGLERFNKLKLEAKIYKAVGHKWQRYDLIDAIKYYKNELNQ
jgi:hypothetical protein